VFDHGQEILCLYRQYDGDPSWHGGELFTLFQGFRIVNGISGVTFQVANGMGDFAAQLVHAFKRGAAGKDCTKNGARVGAFYLYPPGATDVGEEYIYVLTESKGRLWLTVSGGEQENEIYNGLLDAFTLDHRLPELNREAARSSARP
jgi:hypothetical protein